jgi:hypothetical protein
MQMTRKIIPPDMVRGGRFVQQSNPIHPDLGRRKKGTMEEGEDRKTGRRDEHASG